MEYVVIDVKTEYTFGPYETLTEARRYAENELEKWEIINTMGDMVDSS